MATLLDFFKKIPSKKVTKSSPILADTAEATISTSPREKAKVFTPKLTKENRKLSGEEESINSHVSNGGLHEVNNNTNELRNNSLKQELNRKRTISEENSDDDDVVTGRKVSTSLFKHVYF